MYLRTVIILSLLLCNSCVKQKEHVEAVKKSTGAIEIYLFAEKPKSKEGISITQAMKKFTYVNLDDFSESQDTSIMRYDTKLHTFIFAGKLDLPKQENIGELFIESSEIVGLDPSKTDVVLTKSAALKLSKLHFTAHHLSFVKTRDQFLQVISGAVILRL